ncbi:hypothetical protein ACFQZ4_24615 [Catellatospora coxensis]|uniref:PknH-like protein n=1 Tax=Catellatospora coxensis TaxID=310354 RepID=A0A8J3KY28_9ACTN|nr:hypothetical protein [Catellatospora coxensis]GIG05499.1 hypothetical protein Cco03nite_21990 [Catellatospora coxensis]
MTRAVFRIGVCAAALSAIAALGAACSPSVAEPSVAASPSPSARHVALPLDLDGKRMMLVADKEDWGKDLQAALARTFPEAESAVGAAYKIVGGKETVLAGVVATQVADRQAALVTALESLRPVAGLRNPGLTVGRTVSVDAVGPAAEIECGLADGGGADFPVCAWATDTVLGVVVFTYKKPAAQIEAEFHRIRAALEASVA